MGADIHSFAEKKINGKWIRIEEEVFHEYDDNYTSEPFGWRSYAVFGFLADVRNYSHSPVISEPRGLPDDSEYLNQFAYEDYGTSYTNRQDIEGWEYHSMSWLLLSELLEYDYYQKFEDLRYTEQTSPNVFNGAAISEIGKGEITVLKDFLGTGFFKDIDVLKTLGEPENVRIVFYFDN